MSDPVVPDRNVELVQLSARPHNDTQRELLWTFAGQAILYPVRSAALFGSRCGRGHAHRRRLRPNRNDLDWLAGNGPNADTLARGTAKIFSPEGHSAFG